MRRYRRNSVENWGWLPVFFNEKPFFPPISHKKAPVKFFDTDGEKSVPNRKTRFPQKKNKRRSNVFCFKMEAIVHRNLPLEKSVRKVEKSSFIQKRDIRFHHFQLCLWKETLSDNLIHVFLSFRLVSWEGPKLKTFAVNVERLRQKIYRRNFAKIVVIRSPPWFSKIWVVIYRRKFSKKRLSSLLFFQRTPVTAAKFLGNAGNRFFFYELPNFDPGLVCLISIPSQNPNLSSKPLSKKRMIRKGPRFCGLCSVL